MVKRPKYENNFLFSPPHTHITSQFFDFRLWRTTSKKHSEPNIVYVKEWQQDIVSLTLSCSLYLLIVSYAITRNVWLLSLMSLQLPETTMTNINRRHPAAHADKQKHCSICRHTHTHTHTHPPMLFTSSVLLPVGVSLPAGGLSES